MPIPREIRRKYYGPHWLAAIRPRILARDGAPVPDTGQPPGGAPGRNADGKKTERSQLMNHTYDAGDLMRLERTADRRESRGDTLTARALRDFCERQRALGVKPAMAPGIAPPDLRVRFTRATWNSLTRGKR
jgi:hypothetical protein